MIFRLGGQIILSGPYVGVGGGGRTPMTPQDSIEVGRYSSQSSDRGI